MKKRYLHLCFLAIVCLTQTGCLGLLTQLIALPFQIAGKALDIATKLPIPPGVF